MGSEVVGLHERNPEIVPARVQALPPKEVGEGLKRLGNAVELAVKGKRSQIEQMLCGVIAGGHILIEDVPGTGKTTIAHALAKALGLSFSRIQVTSDLLPSDILGVNIFDQKSGTFEFRKGAIFANLVLADEVNRTTPRTQSALLEAMAEGQITIDGITHQLPQPFIVLATQNPREHAGTYPLPESQLDRFLMRLEMGYPQLEVERDILLSRGASDPVSAIQATSSALELLGMQAATPKVHVETSVADYIMRLVEASRKSPLLSLGVSTRGALALLRAAQARALLDGRGFLLPDDVKHMAVPCLAHRIVPAGRDAEEMDRREAARFVQELVERTPLPED